MLDVNSVNNAFTSTSTQFENDLSGRIQALQGKDATNAELINMQFELSRWQLATNLHSNVLRTMSEGIRSTIQNLR
jgi:hypothetical protein